MKIRIRGDSIRLRLKRGEVARIAEGESIVENTHFPGSVLTYRLDVTEDDAINASFERDQIAVSLPASQVAAWADTEEVSLTAIQRLDDGSDLVLLIEKDFTCLDPGHSRDVEDDADSYPHPAGASRNS